MLLLKITMQATNQGGQPSTGNPKSYVDTLFTFSANLGQANYIIFDILYLSVPWLGGSN